MARVASDAYGCLQWLGLPPMAGVASDVTECLPFCMILLKSPPAYCLPPASRLPLTANRLPLTKFNQLDCLFACRLPLPLTASHI